MRRPLRGAEGKPGAGALRRLGEWCARHFVVVVVGRLVALVASRAAGRSVGGTHSDDSTLPDAQSQQDIEVPRKHDPRTGGHSSRIVPHDGRRPLTAPDAQMSAAVAGLEKLPHVLSAQNPLSAAGSSGGRSGPHVGPLSSDGRTGCITARFDVRPSPLDDDHLDGVDDAVRPLREAGAQVEYGGPLGEPARFALRRPDQRADRLRRGRRGPRTVLRRGGRDAGKREAAGP
ncbi:hypothetical protein [Streptomyces sp. NWU49]|uniref:hypothetical protein n=1 Tax=Streptomyces sp. NWU49 TaxID=2201153 RepID=UPI0015E816F0